MQQKYTACGKFILVGEHFILYDIPALAMPWHDVALTLVPTNDPEPVAESVQQAWQQARQMMNLPTQEGFPFHMLSTVPQGAGFGSSAALCLNLLMAAADEAGQSLDVSEQITQATELESRFHGRSSGLDPTVVAMKQPLRVHMGKAPEPLNWRLDGYGFVLSVSREKRQTAQAVGRVREFSEAHPERFQDMRTTMQELVAGVEQCITQPTDDVSITLEERARMLGQWLNQNHELLVELDITSPHLEELIQAAREHGAWGAKLTGAGMGGGMLALAPNDELPTLRRALEAAGGQHSTTCQPSYHPFRTQ